MCAMCYLIPSNFSSAPFALYSLAKIGTFVHFISRMFRRHCNSGVLLIGDLKIELKRVDFK